MRHVSLVVVGVLAAWISAPKFPTAARAQAKPPPAAEGNAAPGKLAQGLTGEEAAKAMTVPAGFSVTLCAAEPDVIQPIAMAIDDRGRVWVAEAYSYPRRVADAEAKDRILVFEDVDGDGRFDKRTVFAEKLNLVSGLEVGFGGVFVGAAPYLLFIPDRDGDDKADGPPQVLLDGFGMQDTHETLNSFIWGPDGWLYGCHGVFTHSKVGIPGAKDEDRVPMNAAVWRYHPTKKKFELFAEGASNQWGVDFNDQGQAFITACVIPHLYHVIQGGRYQRQGGQHFNKFTYDDIKTIAKHRHFTGGQWTAADREKSMAIGGGHAHAGAMIYLGDAWPEKYRNQIFMNNIHGSRINQDQLTRKGSGYEGDAAPDFLFANDAWSQMLYLRYGPDGNVYVIDWYDKNQCHHGNVDGHDRTNGRIFKISYNKNSASPRAATSAASPAGNASLKTDGHPTVGPVGFDLNKLSNRELLALQLSRNDWHVRHARRILQERAASAPLDVADVYGHILALPGNLPTVELKLRAMWASHVTGQWDQSRTIALLQQGSEYEKAWAIQLSCEREQPLSVGLHKAFVAAAQSDSSPVVRLYLASALQRLQLEHRWEIAEALIAHEEDKDDHNLPLMYWYAIEPLIGDDLKRGVALAVKTKIPRLREFITRRATAPPPAASRIDKTGKVPGAIEGESLKVAAITGGKAAPQNMQPFTLDSWSAGEQLWWTGAKQGDKLNLELDIDKFGDFEITAVLSKAIDYGIVQLYLDDAKLGDPIDCFNNGVITTGPISLGTRFVKQGKHILTIEITGANPKAVKAYMFGLDYVKLVEKK